MAADIGDVGAKALADALAKNKGLKKLDLGTTEE